MDVDTSASFKYRHNHSLPSSPQEQSDQQHNQHPSRPVEEWMLICQRNADLQPNMETQEDMDWTRAAQAYPNLEEMPTFICRQRKSAAEHLFSTSANPHHLQGKQLQAYSLVQQHAEAEAPPPLRMIVSGTAGTGKSYLIHCLRLFLNSRV